MKKEIKYAALVSLLFFNFKILISLLQIAQFSIIYKLTLFLGALRMYIFVSSYFIKMYYCIMFEI